jgi:hypothetical protein
MPFGDGPAAAETRYPVGWTAVRARGFWVQCPKTGPKE